MPRKTMVEAIRDAMDVSMQRDENVVVFGEDVGYFGGVFRCTQGLQQKFGASRVFDTPISELGIVGAAVGMAAYGLRPCVEIQFADYMYPAYDQIVSEAARLRYRSNGQFTAPLVVLLQGLALIAPIDVRHPVKVPANSSLEFHASVSLVAYGAFALACIAGVMYLVQERQLKTHQLRSIFYYLPPLTDLFAAITRLLWLGFIL